MEIDIKDQFQTPPEVATYMASLIPPSSFHILEPTPGQGNLSRATGNLGISTGKSFLIDSPGNFFKLKGTVKYDAVIMNPPFSEKHAFGVPADLDLKGMRMGYYMLKRCMGWSDNVIALMPWFTLLDSDVRTRELKEYGLISVTSLPRKTFGYSRIQTCVLQLQKGYKGETLLKTFNFSGL